VNKKSDNYIIASKLNELLLDDLENQPVGQTEKPVFNMFINAQITNLVLKSLSRSDRIILYELIENQDSQKISTFVVDKIPHLRIKAVELLTKKLSQIKSKLTT
jgi:hypothetical protein